jgi:D-alanine--poly(phosphoribitol) ligase subunit 1
MNLENIIFDFFNKKNNFYNIKGDKIHDEKVKAYYYNTKHYLLDNFTVGDKVGIHVQKDYKYILSMLVCFELGITMIPLSTSWPIRRLHDIIKISEPDIIITDTTETLNCKTIQIKDILNFSIARRVSRIQNIDKNNIAYIIFTSGSTGKPKGVMIKRKSYVNFINWVDEYFSDISEKDKLLSTADFTFDLSLIDIALLLSKNIHIYISKFKGNVFELLAEIEELKISTMATVPNNFQMLLSNGVFERGDLSSLRHLLVGGARFSYGLYLKFQKKMKSVNIYNLYGPTEATVYCSVKKITFDDSDLHGENISVGKSILNSKFLLINNDNEKINNYEQGRLLIGGLQVMHGYIKNKKKSQEVLISTNKEVFYDTGDLAFKNTNGDMFIIGRLDDSIKVDGYKVNLSDIDSNIQKLDYVDECATIAIKDSIKENIMIAYIKTQKTITTTIIYQDLGRIMPSYQIPRKLLLVKNLPVNNSGKICKITLQEEYKESITPQKKPNYLKVKKPIIKQ